MHNLLTFNSSHDSCLHMVSILRMCLREVSRLLKLEHISKQFDDKVVLDDINVEIGSGEIVSPLGPSGAGRPHY